MKLNKEELQRVKCNIVLSDTETGARSILVISARRGEGCTSIVGSLAREMADDDRYKILIIDANLRDPSLHDMFKVRRNPGLVDILLGDCEIDEAITDTDQQNLKLLTCGRHVSNPVHLLAQEKLARLLADAADRFDRILIDSSPLMEYPDSIHLASHVDGVIQVVQAGKTRRQVAQEVLRQLEQVQANVIGTVLNRTKYTIPEWLYKYL